MVHLAWFMDEGRDFPHVITRVLGKHYYNSNQSNLYLSIAICNPLLAISSLRSSEFMIVYHRFRWYVTLKNKTPAETFPNVPSVFRVIDKSDRNPPITATSVTFWTSLRHPSGLWLVDLDQPRSQGTLSTSRKYPGCGWSRVYVYKWNPHRGWIFDLILPILSMEVKVALLLYLEISGILPDRCFSPFYLNFYEYEMLIEREVCLFSLLF